MTGRAHRRQRDKSRAPRKPRVHRSAGRVLARLLRALRARRRAQVGDHPGGPRDHKGGFPPGRAVRPWRSARSPCCLRSRGSARGSSPARSKKRKRRRGGRRPAAGEGGACTLRLSADPGGELRFDTRSLEAPAGQVTIEMANPSSIAHNVSIEGGGVDQEGETVSQGGTSTVRAELRPGEYEFYCSVPGHSQGGMEETLTVR
jgi:plastocyanin